MPKQVVVPSDYAKIRQQVPKGYDPATPSGLRIKPSKFIPPGTAYRIGHEFIVSDQETVYFVTTRTEKLLLCLAVLIIVTIWLF